MTDAVEVAEDPIGDALDILDYSLVRIDSEWGASRSIAQLRAAGDAEVAELDAARAAHELAGQRVAALRLVHAKEEFGDCVEDGEPFPCKTIRILDFIPSAEPVVGVGNQCEKRATRDGAAYRCLSVPGHVGRCFYDAEEPETSMP